MHQHWEFALERALAAPDASHVCVLTDRMVFRDGSLPEIVEISARHPERIVSYNLDVVLDMEEPVRVWEQPWSGRVFELEVARLARMAAQSQFPEALPRLLNCIVPGQAIAALRERFGTVFGRGAPDFSFAFRCLVVFDSIAYYDRACLVQHGLAVSTGIAAVRGVMSPELRDFHSRRDSGPIHAAAPVPAFETVTNAKVNEYCLVRALKGGERLPPVDRDAYLAMNDRDAAAMEDSATKARTRELLRQAGWGRLRRLRFDLANTARAALDVNGPRDFLGRAARRLLYAPGLRAAAVRLPTYSTPGEALAAARSGRTMPGASEWHLHRLVMAGGPLHELEGVDAGLADAPALRMKQSA
jgi:hypothetical protein